LSLERVVFEFGESGVCVWIEWCLSLDRVVFEFGESGV